VRDGAIIRERLIQVNRTGIRSAVDSTFSPVTNRAGKKDLIGPRLAKAMEVVQKALVPRTAR
jgi:hypothetical protein